MYERHWKLREKPFENDQNIAYMFKSDEHGEAMIRIVYAVRQSKGLMLLTGESGCGKTYLCHYIQRELESRHNYAVAMIVNPADEPTEFLRQVGFELGLGSGTASKAEVLASLKRHLVAQVAADMRLILIIDNAECIGNDRVFDEVRMLLDLTHQGRPLIGVVLSGQPQLRTALKRVPGLLRRVDVSYHLAPLSERDSMKYIAHRLRVADGSQDIFNERAVQEISRAARGVPRMINNLCDLSLLLSCSVRRPEVDLDIVNEAKEEFRELGLG